MDFASYTFAPGNVGISSDTGKVKPPKAATAPNPGALTQGALEDQVSQSAHARWMATLFGGMGGSAGAASSLLDENDNAQNNRASRVLLGGS